MSGRARRAGRVNGRQAASLLRVHWSGRAALWAALALLFGLAMLAGAGAWTLWA